MRARQRKKQKITPSLYPNQMKIRKKTSKINPVEHLSEQNNPLCFENGLSQKASLLKERNEIKQPEKKKSSLKTYFFTGILVTAPVAITGYLTYEFIKYIDNLVAGFLPSAYNPETYLPFSVPGIGVVIMFLFFIFIGMLTSGYVGRFIVRIGDGIISKMPFISEFYGALKKLFETLFGTDKTAAFRKAVLIEYPRKKLWTIAFVTGEVYEKIRKPIGLEADDSISIYVPTTPNPTSGFLLFVSKKEVIPLEMKVEDAFKLLISTGIVLPEKESSALLKKHKDT
jgi:uncharacterized membrane protein